MSKFYVLFYLNWTFQESKNLKFDEAISEMFLFIYY